jgi:hypothetical protein
MLIAPANATGTGLPAIFGAQIIALGIQMLELKLQGILFSMLAFGLALVCFLLTFSCSSLFE